MLGQVFLSRDALLPQAMKKNRAHWRFYPVQLRLARILLKWYDRCRQISISPHLMRKYAKYIIGGLIVVAMFFLGIASRPERKSELQEAQERYQALAEQYRTENSHCSIAKELGDQLLLVHGEAERIRSRMILTASLQPKKE